MRRLPRQSREDLPRRSACCGSMGGCLFPRPRRPCPGVAVAGELRQWVGAVPGAWIQLHPYPGVTVDGDDAPEQHRRLIVAGKGQCFPVLDDARGGDPPAAPDQAVVLVVTASYEGLGGGYRVAADQRGEHRVGIPARTHIQEMLPSGPMTAPRCPSASSAYSRSTCGGYAAGADSVGRAGVSGRPAPPRCG